MRDEGGRMNAMDAMGAIQDSGFRMRDEGYEVRDTGCEMRGGKSLPPLGEVPGGGWGRTRPRLDCCEGVLTFRKVRAYLSR